MAATATSKPFLLLLILLLDLSPLPSIAAGEPPSAYEMLERFDFPKGILPDGVKGYHLSPDGSFEVVLSGDCEFEVEDGGYLLSYNKRITGRVERGSLKDLRGVRVRVLFVWLGISEVERSDAELDFYIGPLSASFPLSNFEVPPKCRCGNGSNNADALPLFSDS